jgi:hypothetical protein
MVNLDSCRTYRTRLDTFAAKLTRVLAGTRTAEHNQYF